MNKFKNKNNNSKDGKDKACGSTNRKRHRSSKEDTEELSKKVWRSKMTEGNYTSIKNSSRNKRDKRAMLRPPMKYDQTGRRVFYKGENATMCHQCQRNDKGRVINCSLCKTKRFCIPCTSNWYPLLSETDIAEKCPVCRFNCNCKGCLRMTGISKACIQSLEVSRDNEVHYAWHILQYLYPWFKNFHAEQVAEREIESKVQGVDASKLVIPKVQMKEDGHMYCNKCNTSIVDFHRGCSSCSYDLCLGCCREFHELEKPSTNEMLPAGIPCALKKHGCCTTMLELKSVLGENFISQLFEKITKLVTENPSKVEENSGSSSGCKGEAAAKDSSGDNYLYCPLAREVKEGQLRHFQKHWVKGEPVIVRNVLELTRGLSWEPMVMWRALRDTRFKDQESSGQDERLTVYALHCLDWSIERMGIHAFFKGYSEGQSYNNDYPKMLKVDDWPPANTFAERLPRHTEEIKAALPFKEYTHPKGPLNLAAKLPQDMLGTKMYDMLGTKMYIGYGIREELGEGDSVTKLHSHMHDVVNILTHTAEVGLTYNQSKAVWKRHKQEKYKIDESKGTDDNLKSKEDYGDGGALWDIWRREDVPKLKEFLIKHASEFVHCNKPVSVVDHPIHDNSFYLRMEHKEKLREEYGIEAWTFEQNLGEAVLIPAGCPHQVRNLKSCIKVAQGFVSPESWHECIRLLDEFRVKEDKPEVKQMAVFALIKAIKDIEGDNIFPYKSTFRMRAEEDIKCKRKRTQRRMRKRKWGSYHNVEGKENETWTEPQRFFLIELLRAFNGPHHRDINGWKQKCWSEIAKHFNEKFPLVNFSIKQLKEQEQDLEKAYKVIKGLKGNDGFVWDFNTKKVTAQSDAPKDLFEKNPLAKEWHGKTFLYYDRIEPLYEGCILEDSQSRETSQAEFMRNTDESPRYSWQSGEDCFVNTENESIPCNQEPSSTQNNFSFHAPYSPQYETPPQKVETEPSTQNSRYIFEAPDFPQAEPKDVENGSHHGDSIPCTTQEPCFTQNSPSIIQLPYFPEVEISTQNLENKPIPPTQEPNFTRTNSSIQVPNFPQVEISTQNVENEPLPGDSIPPNCTRIGSPIQVPYFPQVEISTQNVENKPLPGDSTLSKESNFTQNISSISDISQVELSRQNMENRPLHSDPIPPTQEPNFTRNSSPIQEPNSPRVQTSPQNVNNFPPTQEPILTQNNSSGKVPDFSQAETLKLFHPQQEASVQHTRKHDYSETERSETNTYEMEKQDDISRMRLELEIRRLDLEIKYSFKNAMDIFDSLDGFSFEDYDKVSKLFIRDEKIRNAFIDVKEEYKNSWIRLRIDEQ